MTGKLGHDDPLPPVEGKDGDDTMNGNTAEVVKRHTRGGGVPQRMATSPQQAQQQAQPARGERTANITSEQRQDFFDWLTALLIARGYAHEGVNGPHFSVNELKTQIDLRNPLTPISYNTLAGILYSGNVPTHQTRKMLQEVLHVSEIAIMLHSGQLELDALIPLFGLYGEDPVDLLNDEEYQYLSAELATEIPNPEFRARMQLLLDHEASFTRHFHDTLLWLGLTEEEYEQVRADLNTPGGRQRLMDDLALDADDEGTEEEYQDEEDQYAQGRRGRKGERQWPGDEFLRYTH